MTLTENAIEISWLGGPLDSIPYESITGISFPENFFFKYIVPVAVIHTAKEKIEIAPFRRKEFFNQLKTRLGYLIVFHK